MRVCEIDCICTGQAYCDMIFANLERLPILGMETYCEEFVIRPGGGANTPTALSKLGLNAMYAAVIGRDDPGDLICSYLQKAGLNMEAVIRPENSRTSVSASLSLKHDRGFASYESPARYKLVEAQVKKFITASRHVHAYIDDCLNMDIVGIAKSNGKTLSVDTGWNENIKIKDIKDIVRSCDIFFTNQLEGGFLTDCEAPEDILRSFSALCPVVVVKLGNEGSIIAYDGKERRIPPVRTELKDTTGAGDLYAAGFLYGILTGMDIEACAKFASASGGLAVSFYGGVSDSYSMENLTKLLNGSYTAQ